MLKDYFQTFKKYKNLIVYLAKNQISLRYRKSYLGMLWSLLNPLLTMIVLTMVFSTIFKNQIENFPIYLMCGRLFYDYNSEATKTALNSVVSNSSLIKKPIFYPFESVPEMVQNIIRLNPLYHYIEMFRGLIMYGTLPTLRENLLCGGMGIGILLIGVLFFKKTQDRFILHI